MKNDRCVCKKLFYYTVSQAPREWISKASSHDRSCENNRSSRPLLTFANEGRVEDRQDRRKKMDRFTRMTGMGTWSDKRRQRRKKREASVVALHIKTNDFMKTWNPLSQWPGSTSNGTAGKEKTHKALLVIYLSAMGNGGKSLLAEMLNFSSVHMSCDLDRQPPKQLLLVVILICFLFLNSNKLHVSSLICCALCTEMSYSVML